MGFELAELLLGLLVLLLLPFELKLGSWRDSCASGLVAPVLLVATLVDGEIFCVNKTGNIEEDDLPLLPG